MQKDIFQYHHYVLIVLLQIQDFSLNLWVLSNKKEDQKEHNYFAISIFLNKIFSIRLSPRYFKLAPALIKTDVSSLNCFGNFLLFNM